MTITPMTKRNVKFGLALLLATLAFVPFMPSMPSSGLDASWAYALNEAVAHHLVFGKDFLFTFGPLGSAFSRLYSPETDRIMLITSASVMIGTGAGLAILFEGDKFWALAFLPIAVALRVLPDSVFLNLALVLFLACYKLTSADTFTNGSRRDRMVNICLLILSGCAGLLPIIKGSYSVLTLLLGLISLAVLIFNRLYTKSLLLVIGGALGIVSGWLLAKQNLSDLLPFLIAQGPIISGYSDAMSQAGSTTPIVVWIAIFIGLAAIVWIDRIRSRRRFPAVLIITLSLYFFIVFKASFVRNDDHALIAANCSLLAACCIPFVLAMRREAAALLIVGGIVISLTIPGTTLVTLADHAGNSFIQTYKGIKLRIISPEQLRQSYTDANRQIARETPVTSASGTFDLYPYDLSAIFANQLPWKGRPIIQSYSVYTPELARMNARSLSSPHGPDNVLFMVTSIDGRLPALEDGHSWPILLDDYALAGEQVGHSGQYLRFQRLPETQDSPKTSGPLLVTGQMGRPVELPSWSGLMLASFDVRPSLAGKLLTVLFQPGVVRIKLWLSDGRKLNYRFVTGMASEDFIISPFVEDSDDFSKLARGRNHARVTAIQLDADHAWPWQRSFSIRLSQRPFTGQPSAQAYWRAKIAETDKAAASGFSKGSADCFLERVNEQSVDNKQSINVDSNRQVSFQGWAIPSISDGISTDHAYAHVTYDDGSSHFFPASNLDRNDVGIYFHRPRLVNIGFKATIEAEDLQNARSISLLLASGNIRKQCTFVINAVSR